MFSNNNNNNNSNATPRSTTTIASAASAQMTATSAKDDASKRSRREKFVAIYESFFKGEDPSNGKLTFWLELFLLKVNVKFLESRINSTTEEELLNLQKTLNTIFSQCLFALQDSSPIRRVNALQTMCILFEGIFRKKWTNFNVEVLTVTCGFENADMFFKQLITRFKTLITEDTDVNVKEMVMFLCVVLLTGAENINQNALNDYFVLNDIFYLIVYIIRKHNDNIMLSKNAVVSLVILCNYRKYEAENQYLKRLCSMQQPEALVSFSKVIALSFQAWNAQFEADVVSGNRDSMISRMYSWVSSMVWSTPGVSPSSPNYQSRSLNNVAPMLIAFYELAYLNKDFVGAMTRSLAFTAMEDVNTNGQQQQQQHETERTERGCPAVLRAFIELVSVMFQDYKDLHNKLYTKLAMITLRCLTQNEEFNTFIFDSSIHLLGLKVYQKEKDKFVVKQFSGQGSIATALFELLLLFLTHNMKKRLHVDMFQQCLSIFHSLMCFGKESRVRLMVPWRTLWESLVRILEVVAVTDSIPNRQKSAALIRSVLRLLNFAITHGNSFLPSPKDYDELFYEFVRQQKVFGGVVDWIKRNHKLISNNAAAATASTTTFKNNNNNNNASPPLINDMENIQTIISHFSTKIELQFGSSEPSNPDQVLNIIKNNYETLNLKLDVGILEDSQEYIETLNYVPFFSQLIRVFCTEVRDKVLEQSAVCSNNILNNYFIAPLQ